MARTVTVLGSLNVDTTSKIEKIPLGEDRC